MSMLLTLAMTVATQAPAASITEADVAPSIAGAALGALGGAVTFGAPTLLFSMTCIEELRCPWGDDGGAMLGAAGVVPAATLFGALVGGVTGVVIGLRVEQNDNEAHRLAAEARQQQAVLALRTTSRTPVAKAPPPPPPEHPESAARAPDDVDDDG